MGQQFARGANEWIYTGNITTYTLENVIESESLSLDVTIEAMVEDGAIVGHKVISSVTHGQWCSIPSGRELSKEVMTLVDKQVSRDESFIVNQAYAEQSANENAAKAAWDDIRFEEYRMGRSRTCR